MKKRYYSLFFACLTGFLVMASSVFAGDYNYISASALKDRIDKGSAPVIIDICPVEQYAAGHIEGAIETNAYPVKTDEEKQRLAEQLDKLQETEGDVVVVCPGGAGGAKRTIDYYQSRGVDGERLLILENGMNKWPYETEKN